MFKPYKIIYYPTAMEDVRSILNYISIDNPSAAHGLIEKIDHAIHSLAEFPNKGVVPNDINLKNKKYRMLIIESYIVFYIPNDKSSEIEIMRVLSSKQNYKTFL